MTDMTEPVEPSDFLKAIKAKVTRPSERKINEFQSFSKLRVQHDFAEVVHYQIKHRVSVEYGKTMWLTTDDDAEEQAIKNVWMDLHDKMYSHLKDPLLELHRAICDGDQDEARVRCDQIMKAVFYPD